MGSLHEPRILFWARTREPTLEPYLLGASEDLGRIRQIQDGEIDATLGIAFGATCNWSAICLVIAVA